MARFKKQAVSLLTYWSYWFAFLFGFWVLAVQPPNASAQLTGDPTVEPFPILDFDDPEKSISVQLHFLDRFTVVMESAQVIRERSHGRMGDPPLLHVELRDLNDNLLEEFNAWHPLWASVEDGLGGEKLTIQPEATGLITFPFRPNVAMMNVVDVAAEQEVISVDLIPTLHAFCRDNLDDQDCTNIVNRPPNCNANGPYLAECAGPMTPVMLDSSGSGDPDGDRLVSYAWTGPFVGNTTSGTAPTVQFSSIGVFEVGLEVGDEFNAATTCSSSITVKDTTPPTITNLTASPNMLWPPNHKMIPVTVDVVATDGCDAGAVCRIVSVVSNEPEKSSGTGNATPDWELTGDLTVDLRAERSGSGSGRVYTVKVECTDASRNSVERTVDITVPHDKKGLSG